MPDNDVSLYGHEPGDFRNLLNPVVVIAFGGWNDAGSAATAAVAHLDESYGGRPVFALDPDDYYDFQVNRPQVSLEADGLRTIAWPTTEFRRGHLPDGRDLVLVQGLEPNLRWRQFSSAIVSALRSAGVRRVCLLGALLADTPHTRPVPVSASTNNGALMAEFDLTPSTYEGPTGIVGVVGDALERAGIEVLSLWAAIPHYVSAPPCPKGTLALLTALEHFLDFACEMGELPEQAQAWERDVDELAADDSEVAEYVASLEHQQDAIDLPEVSGETIAAEFERYLRRRSG